jgi:hypothetical protein
VELNRLSGGGVTAPHRNHRMPGLHSLGLAFGVTVRPGHDRRACISSARETTLPIRRCYGRLLRRSTFWVIWEPPADGPGLTWVRFHDLCRFAATMFACTGASTKEIMQRVVGSGAHFRADDNLERKTGFEPATLTLARWWFSCVYVWRVP